MAKKVVDQDAYDVSPAVKKATLTLLENLTKDLEAGCRSVEKGAYWKLLEKRSAWMPKTDL